MTSRTEVLQVQLPLRDDGRGEHPAGARRMLRSDIPGLVSLWQDGYPPAITEATSSAEIEADWTAAFDGDYRRLAPAASLVIEHDARIVAAFKTVVDPVWAGTPRGPFIIEVIVRPEFRRQDLARGLLTAALAALSLDGFRVASLNVELDNQPAQRLYRSLGFAPPPTRSAR